MNTGGARRGGREVDYFLCPSVELQTQALRAPSAYLTQTVRQSRDGDESSTRRGRSAPRSTLRNAVDDPGPTRTPGPTATLQYAPQAPSMNPSATMNPPCPGSSRTSTALSLSTLTPLPIVELQDPRLLPGDSRLHYREARPPHLMGTQP